MVLSTDARHLTSYISECQVSKKVKDISSNRAYFAELEKTQTISTVKTEAPKVLKPYK